MIKLNKKIIGIVMLAIFLFAGGTAFAQTEDLPDPGMLPDHPLYFMKRGIESVGTFFCFGNEAKANRYLELSEKRLSEIKALTGKEENSELTKKVLERYKEQMNKALEKAEKAKEKGRDMDEMLGRFSEASSKHQKTLAEVYEKVPEEAREGIQRAMEAGLERNEKAVNAISEENREEAREMVREKRQEINERLDGLRKEGKSVPEFLEIEVDEEKGNSSSGTSVGEEGAISEDAGEVEEPNQGGQDQEQETIDEEAETGNAPENSGR